MDNTDISKDEGNISSSNGKKRDDITNREWEVMLLWKAGFTYWIHLKDIKGSNLVEVAEYTGRSGILLVGFQSTEASEYNHIQSEFQVFEGDTEVWDQIAQDCRKEIED